MHEVGASKLEGTGVRPAPLERDHRDDQAGEPEPDHSRQQSEDAEQAEQDDHGNQCDRSERRRLRESPTRDPLSGDDSGRERERETRGHRRNREGERQPRDPRRLGEGQARGGGSRTQDKRAPETVPVEADRLGDELADGARLRR